MQNKKWLNDEKGGAFDGYGEFVSSSKRTSNENAKLISHCP